jgi:GNAT superfamily N-acetyltransferase
VRGCLHSGRELTVAADIRVHRLRAFDERAIEELASVLIDCVEGGASVSFMLPLSPQKAGAYWRDVAASAMRGERAVLAAVEPAGSIVGTVQVILDLPENQPHRGDVAKMLVHRRARGRGVGAALLVGAEECALEEGRNLPARLPSTSSRCGSDHRKSNAARAAARVNAVEAPLERCAARESRR